MSLFRRSRAEQRQWLPEPVVPAFPGASPLGLAPPSSSMALQVSAVWACVRLMADTVSMMPLNAYTLSNGERVPAQAPPLVRRPSRDATMPEWLYMVIVSLMLRGNFYGRIVARDSFGLPTQVEPLNPDHLKVRVGDDGTITYSLSTTTIPAADVLHIRAYLFPGERQGLSPIAYAARQINTDIAVREFGYGFFRDGAHPSSILSSDTQVTQEQARSIKERFLAAVKGREPAVLSGGLKYQSIQVNPEESQFLLTQRYGVSDIARIFGVPPELIGGDAGNSMTYSNVEQRGIDFLTYSVQPWLTRLESALADLLPGDQHVRFDTSALLRTDVQTLMTATAIGIASKQLTPDEARGMADRPPLTEQQKELLDLVPLTVSPSGKPKHESPSTLPDVNFQDPALEGQGGQ